MSENNLLAKFWQGYLVTNLKLEEDKKQVFVFLEPIEKNNLICSCCKSSCSSIHDSQARTIRDCNLLDCTTYLIVPIRRVNCYNCGTKREFISWLDNYSRYTSRFIENIEKFCKVLPTSTIAKEFKLHWDSVRRIDEKRLEREVKAPDYSKVTHLVMDEFALHKGHRYATIIADALTMKVLWIGEGRSREQIRPFFEELGENCKNIQAVAMDMNTSFDLEVKAHCPKAEVVYDLFHVVAKFGREVVDRVRVDRANELKDDKKARQFVKRGRWLLLRNSKNLDEKQSANLAELLVANEPLSKVYILKESLKNLWFGDSVWESFKRWRSWSKQALESGLKPIKEFVRKLKPYIRGILSSSKFRLNTSCLEGINNKVKLIKRMGYGYRNTNYFFTKLKSAFPGKA